LLLVNCQLSIDESRMLTRWLVLTVVFIAGAGLVALAERPEPVPERKTFDRFPLFIDEWRGMQQPPFEDSVLALLGVDDYLPRAYFNPDGAGVGVYVGFYGSQRQGDTMHSPQNCLPGAGWQPVSHSLLPITVAATDGAGDREIVVNRYIIEKGLDRQVVLYWYQAHDRVVASEYWAKYFLIRDAVTMNRTDGALVRVMTPYTGSENEAAAEALVVDFVKKMFPLLEEYIPS
jgi:EpsI family protein